MAESDPQLPEAVIGAWRSLRVGAQLTIVKIAPEGSEAARYSGEVAVGLDDDAWIVVHAIWTHRTIELDGLEFRAGDELLEWFSPRHPVNAFAVLTADDQFKGWYANVTHPARLDLTTDPPVLVWHDLYVDLVGLPDNTFTIRDDDELLASRLGDLDPDLHERILRARSEMIWRFERRLPPFVGVFPKGSNPSPSAATGTNSVNDESNTGTDFVHPH